LARYWRQHSSQVLTPAEANLTILSTAKQQNQNNSYFSQNDNNSRNSKQKFKKNSYKSPAKSPAKSHKSHKSHRSHKKSGGKSRVRPNSSSSARKQKLNDLLNPKLPAAAVGGEGSENNENNENHSIIWRENNIGMSRPTTAHSRDTHISQQMHRSPEITSKYLSESP